LDDLMLKILFKKMFLPQTLELAKTPAIETKVMTDIPMLFLAHLVYKQ
jgi:hypothetical protein